METNPEIKNTAKKIIAKLFYLYCDSQIAVIQCSKSVRASRDTVPIRASTRGEGASHVGMVAELFYSHSAIK